MSEEWKQTTKQTTEEMGEVLGNDDLRLSTSRAG